MAMALNINFNKINAKLKNLPPYLKAIVLSAPSIVLIILFIILLYMPKSTEINGLEDSIAKLDSEISTSEIKAKKLVALKIENARLKTRLAKLKEQLPEENEVSGLLRQISDLGLKAGLKIILWKPEGKSPDSSGLYVKIPVTVDVITGYHNLGVFFSYISRLPRIVNISGIKLSNPALKEGFRVLSANFTATTFSAVPEPAEPKEAKKP